MIKDVIMLYLRPFGGCEPSPSRVKFAPRLFNLLPIFCNPIHQTLHWTQQTSAEGRQLIFHAWRDLREPLAGRSITQVQEWRGWLKASERYWCSPQVGFSAMGRGNPGIPWSRICDRFWDSLELKMC